MPQQESLSQQQPTQRTTPRTSPALASTQKPAPPVLVPPPAAALAPTHTSPSPQKTQTSTATNQYHSEGSSSSSGSSIVGVTSSWNYVKDANDNDRRGAEDETSSAPTLPSTVDVNALKAGPTNDNASKRTESSSGSSNSEGSDSSTDTDSTSTSEEKTNKSISSTQAPQFSVTSSDTAGLRMKIAAIPRLPRAAKAGGHQLSRKVNSAANNNNSIEVKKTNIKSVTKPNAASSSSSYCSACSESDSDTTTSEKDSNPKRKRTKIRQKEGDATRSETSSSGDSNSSESDSSVESQKNQCEPKQSEAPSKTPIVKSATSNLPDASCCDGASSSDMELPALVNAAIQRVESGSDGESSKTGPSVQYTSTLLRDFVAKTQMLGNNQLAMAPSPLKSNALTDAAAEAPSNEIKSEFANATACATGANVKRKRGRPKKVYPPISGGAPPVKATTKTATESPDSGILSTVQTPPPSPKQVAARRRGANQASAAVETMMPPMRRTSKLVISNLDKQMYATERVLYPPRARKRGPGRPPLKNKTALSEKPTEDHLDPVWRRIDVNNKFRRPSVSGYKSDGGCSTTVCSKILAAQSGYISDYGGVRSISLSGYKTDCTTRKSGYRSDYSSRTRSCGYRSDGGVRHRKKVRRKRRTKNGGSTATPNNQRVAAVTEQDILQLAGLTLGHTSEESSRDSISTFASAKLKNKTVFGNVFGTEKTHKKPDKPTVKKADNVEFSPVKIERATSMRSLLDVSILKPASIKGRRSSAVSRCSSRSTTSRHHPHRRRRKRMRSRCFLDGTAKAAETKIAVEIEQLTNSFTNQCAIHMKEKEKPIAETVQSAKVTVAVSKRVAKKRKGSENADSPSTTASGSKRRHKKTVPTQSPDDHKLPLKKRHYLLTPGEKPEEKLAAGDDDGCDSGISHTSSSSVKVTTKAVTPKKRHLLEKPELVSTESVATTAAAATATACAVIKSSDSPITIVAPAAAAVGSETPPPADASSVPAEGKKNDIITRKKNRLEVLVSKMQPNSPGAAVPEVPQRQRNVSQTRPSVIRTSTTVPPPGVFEPTIDLELQIPASTIAIPSVVTKSELLDSPQLATDVDAFPKQETDETVATRKQERVVEILLNKTSSLNALKKKRKKQINRTGFPTIKRKKKKSTTVDEPLDVKPLAIMPVGPNGVRSRLQLNPASCDRVPNEGEAADTFIERNVVKPRLSVVSLERLQGKIEEDIEVVSKRQLRARSRESHAIKPAPEESISPSPPVTELLRKKEQRDISSENEPLITFVNHKRIKIGLSNLAVEAKRKCKVEEPTTVEQQRRSARRSDVKEKQPSDEGVATEAVKERSQRLHNRLSAAKVQDDDQMRRISHPAQPADKVAVEPLPNGKIDRRTKAWRCIKARPDATESNPSAHRTRIVRPRTPSDELSDEKENLTLNKRRKLADIKPCPLDDELEHEPLPELKDPEVSSRDESPASSLSERIGKKSAKVKKRYLPAGLFSDYYKDEGHKNGARIVEDNSSSFLLPPPPYCEKYFRQTVDDFVLPFDLWQAHDTAKLPGRDTVPSWNYKKIRTNIYCDVRANPTGDQQPCSCPPNSGCTDDCLNRLVYTECLPENCPCGDQCLNQKIQRHEYPSAVERFMTDTKGWGVRTQLPIAKGTFILEYVGEVVTEREFKDRMASLYVRDTHHYCLHLDGGLVIDGHRMGSDGRFVNHSCAPNCEMQKWSVNGLSRMALFALRDIRPGEELTYDYNFALFNPSEGQPCHCRESQCRGVIGGKSQRVKPVDLKIVEATTHTRIGRPRKRQAKKNQPLASIKDGCSTQLFQAPTPKETVFIRDYHCFLVRNLGKIRRLKERSSVMSLAPTPASLMTRISALRAPRNIRTRGLAMAEHNPEIERTAQMAGILRDLCKELEMYKDELCDSPILKLGIPSKKKCPLYFEKIQKPIDLALIIANVEKGEYKEVTKFDEDMLRMFNNAKEFFTNDSEEAIGAERMLTLYRNLKEAKYNNLLNIVGDKRLLKAFAPVTKLNELIQTTDPNEDIIRCLCGLYKDEGLMIQCAKCLVWQHTECVRADTSIEKYFCEQCENRCVDLEIPLEEFTDEGYRYFLSLVRGDLQIRQGDTVYVLRDIPMSPNRDNPDAPLKKHTYETIGHIDYSECDIFRIERLWKDNAGKRFVFGHHYLRPHETYHEPTRKFYANEVVRVPLFEVVPIELVIDRCWVMDPTTFCKGRPVDCAEEHVYICELRVDKGARLFSKISRHAHPIVTKSYAFRKFEQKLKISRNYAPHDVDSHAIKPKRKKNDESVAGSVTSRKNSTSILQLISPPIKTLSEKRGRLEDILQRLMNVLRALGDSTPPMDLSYLLTGRGARLRRANATVVPQ